jgi:hypothetical protein
MQVLFFTFLKGCKHTCQEHVTEITCSSQDENVLNLFFLIDVFGPYYRPQRL